MKFKAPASLFLVVLFGSILAGCNDAVVPDQRIVDQMNSQRKKQQAAPKDGAAPANNGNPYTTGSH